MAAARRLSRAAAHLRPAAAAAPDPRGAGPSSPFAGSHFTPRSDSLEKHIDAPPVVLPPELSASAAPALLSDLQMQTFLQEGYVAIRVDAGAIPLHQEVCERLDAVLEAEGNPTNNLVARVPAVQQVLDHPAVRGALTSLLGEGSVLGPHRYVHTTKPPSGDGGWHKVRPAPAPSPRLRRVSAPP